MKVAVSILLLVWSYIASADVATKSCSGTIRYCDDFGICTDDYFYLYAYQSTLIRNGQIQRIRSRLRLRGSIGSVDDYYQTLELIDDRVTYLGLNYDLAIPVRSELSVLYRKKDSSEWNKLCD